MKAIAPGKLILSGEHAIVHGAPALAMAVDRFAEATVTVEQSKLIAFDFLNLSYHKAHTLKALKMLKKRLTEDYQKFLRGEYGIRDVLKKPFELSQYALTSILDKLNLTPPEGGLKLQTHSSIPIGCGMGSSAAMILSVMHAIREHYNIELNHDTYLSYGMEIENLQHGPSSGLDLQVSLSGGCLRQEKEDVTAREIPELPMYLINTGKPQSTTGECVSHTQQFFGQGGLCNDFATVTNQMDEALQTSSVLDVKNCIQQNHRLLVKIGVVPQKVQLFIKEVEAFGAAAKICGAGSICGQEAGIALIVSEKDPSELCKHHGYVCSPVKGEKNGLRTI